jgi:hypothetical protein
MFTINCISLARFYPEYRRFLKELHHLEDDQEQILLGIIRKHAHTVFGKEHGFDAIHSVADFRKRVPLSDYEDYVRFIERAKAGEANVLTGESIKMLEPTGGSSSGSKLIPYTQGLEEEFMRGIYPWLADLYLHRPYLLNGKTYWAVTPTGDVPHAGEGTIPVGFKDDTEYLGAVGRLIEKTMAVPAKLGRIHDTEEFLYASALLLLRERNLTLISVWSPTFLLILIDKIRQWWGRLLQEIASGSEMYASLRPCPSRTRELELCWDGSKIEFQAVWRKLRFVSCWADGPSRAFSDKVRRVFPGVEIQGKGLLATEGIVSFPLTGASDPILSYRSHYYEFLDRATGGIVDAGKLRTGKYYSVVITTSGGLYRYRMRDIIEVTGNLRGVPLLRFCGKEDLISDLCGEKLNEFFVRNAIDSVLTKLGIRPGFRLFAPCSDHNPHYCLLLQAHMDKRTKDMIEKRLDAELRENFHYHYARDLQQLGSVEIKLIDTAKDAMGIYTQFLVRQGKKLGAIKPFLFHNREGIEQLFGEFGIVHHDSRAVELKRDQ